MPRTPGVNRTPEEAEAELREAIRTFYFGWAAPIDRTAQLLGNLKLGFGLLFALVLFFFFWGAAALWDDQLVRAFTTFTTGAANNRSGGFDDPAARKKRKNNKASVHIFPVPSFRHTYVIAWLALLALTLVVADWAEVVAFVSRLFQ